MRLEITDLRRDGAVVKTPPLSWAASLIIASLLCISGIAFAFIGIGAEGDHERTTPAIDPRPYLLLSTTMDLVVDVENTSYQDLPLTSLVNLLLAGQIELDQNMTSELESRASFLYPGANGIVLSASADGAPETMIFGWSGSGEPIVRIATFPSGGGLLIITLTVWGLEE